MKTLFLTVYDRIQIKNLLRTRFLDDIVGGGVRVVLFVPDHKIEYYRREFSSPGVLIEGVPPLPKSGVAFFVELLAQAALRTSTVWSFYVQRARISGKWGKYAIYLASYALLSNPVGWALIRFLNRVVVPDNLFDRYFDRYKPDLVFASNITSPLDRGMTRTAHRHGVRVVGANKSWDTLSSKGYLDIQADMVIAQNDLQAEELRTLQGYRGKIVVAGYPWFDFFLDTKGLLSREDFCKSKGLDPSKKIIYYFLSAKFINPFPEEHIAILSDLIQRGVIREPAQILVAPRPKYEFDIDRVKSLPNVVAYMPPTGTRGAALDWEEVSIDEIEDFRNQTFHSDVIVNASSTMSIEGALMDRPIISMNFDPLPVSYWQSVRVRHEDYHWKRLMQSGGVVEVRNAEELGVWVNRYLDHPETLKDERLRLVAQQNRFQDAHSCARWVEIIRAAMS